MKLIKQIKIIILIKYVKPANFIWYLCICKKKLKKGKEILTQIYLICIKTKTVYKKLKMLFNILQLAI